MTDQPAYDQVFYAAIIAERRKLGETAQYVSIDDCMLAVGRAFDDGQGGNSQD